MAIQCKVVKGINPRHPEAGGQYTLRAVSSGLYGFEQMCEDICRSSSLTEGDVAAAMRSMLHFAREALLAGQTVEMEGLGRFRITVKSRLCTPEETARRSFSVADVVRQYKLQFTPDVRLGRLIAARATAEKCKD
jgi:predicted histone-like DNA-binding protein